MQYKWGSYERWGKKAKKDRIGNKIYRNQLKKKLVKTKIQKTSGMVRTNKQNNKKDWLGKYSKQDHREK